MKMTPVSAYNTQWMLRTEQLHPTIAKTSLDPWNNFTSLQQNMGKSLSRSKTTSYPLRSTKNVTSLAYISTPK